ncbi:MAG TPA: TIGR03435 family protein [Vicinamibacterales bacterium]|nr:TIGR03435 family protein [Vicinamibacterales bacterium]
MKRHLVLLLSVFAATGSGALHGKTRSEQKPLAFEAASIKPNVDAGAMRTWVVRPNGGVTITAYDAFQLIAIAYDSLTIQTRDQIVGGPAWLKSERFDIVAKADGSLDDDETGRPTKLLAMLRSLLEERFKLRLHSEQRETSVYLLTRTNNRTLGPQLRPTAQDDCRGPSANFVPENSTRWCGWRGLGTGHFTIQGLTMEDLARGLAGTWSVGRPVLDRTGLAGRWDAQIDFVPTFVPGPNDPTLPAPNPAADTGPSLLSAMRDQLGLKLQSAKAKAEFLVIDHVERPAPD